MRKLAVVLAALGMMGSFTPILDAQQLQEGKWTGTRINPNGNNQNITFEVKRIPDPHARWRPSTEKILTVTIMGGQNSFQLREIRLDGESLSYVIPQQAFELRCNLTRQKDGSFAGKCTRMRDNAAGPQITMIPPKE